MIELNLDTMAVDADCPSAEMVADGASALVHVQVIGGNDLPFADPNSPGRPMRAPALAVNFALSRNSALKLAELIREKAESLPDASASSKLAVVSDMSEASKVVRLDDRLRGK